MRRFIFTEVEATAIHPQDSKFQAQVSVTLANDMPASRKIILLPGIYYSAVEATIAAMAYAKEHFKN